MAKNMCPAPTAEWKKLVSKYGESKSYLLYYANNNDTPSLDWAENYFKQNPQMLSFQFDVGNNGNGSFVPYIMVDGAGIQRLKFAHITKANDHITTSHYDLNVSNLTEVFNVSPIHAQELYTEAVKYNLAVFHSQEERNKYDNAARKGRAFIERSLFNNETTLSSLEVAKNVIASAKDASIGKRLLTLMMNSKTFPVVPVRLYHSGTSALGYYDTKARAVSMDPYSLAMVSYHNNGNQNNLASDFATVFAHEMTHAAISTRVEYYIQNNGNKALLVDTGLMTEQEYNAISKLSDLHSRISDYAKEKGYPEYYGLKNVHELISETFTNREFVSFLNEISDDIVTDQDRSLLDRIFDAVAEFLNGLLGIETSELNDLIRALSAQLIQDRQSLKEQVIADLIKKEKKVQFMAEFSINEAKDIAKLIKNTGSHHQNPGEALVNSIYKRLHDEAPKGSNQGKIRYFGKLYKFDLTESESVLKGKIKAEIVDRILEFQTKAIDNLKTWINAGATKESYGHIMGQEYKDRVHPDINANIAQNLLVDHLQFEFDEKAYRLSDADLASKIGINVKNFEGMNPLVLLHGETEDGKPVISLFDMVNIPLNDYTTQNVFDKISQNLGINLGNKFKANELGVRKLLLTLNAIAIKNSNPNVVIRKAGVIRVAGNVQKLESSYINLQDSIIDLKEILDKPGVLDMFSSEMKSVLNNPDLFKPELYDISYLWWFVNWAKSKSKRLKGDNATLVNEETTWTSYYASAVADKYDEFSRFVADNMKNEEDPEKLLQFFKDRQKFIMDVLYPEYKTKPDVEQAMKSNIEYQLVNQSIIQLTKKVKHPMTRTRDISKVAKMIHSQQNMENPIVQYAMISMQDWAMRTRTEYLKWYNPVREMFGKVERDFFNMPENAKYRIGNRLVDVSSEKFKRIVKTKTVKDKSGNNHTVLTNTIHHDLADAETKSLYNEGKLTDDDIKFGKMLFKTYRDWIVKYMVHKETNSKDYITVLDPKDKAEMLKEINDRVNAIVDEQYDGRVLILPKSSKELFFSGEVSKSFTVMMEDITSPERLFAQDPRNKNSEIMTASEAVDYYIQQLLSDDNSEDTIGKFGLAMDENGMYVEDPNASELLSTDLEFSTKLFVMSTSKMIQSESYLLPRVNAAMNALYNYENSRGTAMVENQDYILKRFKMLINGQTDLDDINKIMLSIPGTDKNVSLGKAVMGANHALIFGNLALNIGTGITQALVNVMAIANNALANTGSDYHAGAKEIALAAKEFMTNHKKVINVVTALQLVDMDTNTLVSGDRKGIHTEMTRDVWNSHVFQWLNWAPDYSARVIVSIAQMIKDGTWNAMNEDGSYDESKDSRYNNEVGKKMREYRKRKLIEQGHMDSNASKLTSPYINEEIFSIRDQSSQHIVGGYMSDEKGVMQFGVVGRLFSTYKTWLFNKITNFYKTGFEKEVSGRLVSDKDGNIKWENEYFEGKLQSLGAAYRILKEQYHSPLQAWAELKPRQQQNLKRLLLDTLMFAMLTALFRGAFDDDDDKNVIVGKHTNANGIMRSLQYATSDLTNEWYPPALMDLVKEPFPVIGFGKKIAGLLESLYTFDKKGVASNAWKLAPFTNTITFVTDFTPRKAIEEREKAERKKLRDEYKAQYKVLMETEFKPEE